MDFLDRLPLPKRLNSQVWLFALPSALMSFEKRQGLPPMPIGKARVIGAPLIAAGIGLVVWASQHKGEPIPVDERLSRLQLAQRPATTGGILGLAGLAFLTKSTVLLAYSVALALASESQKVEIEDPDLETLVP
jgi:hypothetical protein